MSRTWKLNYGRRLVKQASMVSVCLLSCSLFLPRIGAAQSTQFSKGERLTVSGAEGQTEQQLLAELLLARQMLGNSPNSAQSYLRLGRALRALDDMDAASKAFDRALEMNPKFAEALFEKGLIIADGGDWAKAADFLRRALEASQDYVPAHLALGEMLLRMGDFDNSASELKTVVRLDPKSAGAYQGLGLIYLQEGDLDAAADCFHHALAIRPRYFDAETGLARTLSHQHRWLDAVKLLKRVVAENPDSAEETVSLGKALANMGDKAGAQAQFARARVLSDKEVTMLRAKGENNSGVALRKDGKLQEATAAFRRAFAADPAFCEAHDNLGGVLWLQKDPASALSEFQAAVRCDPKMASARNNLGLALLYHSHEVDRSIEEFRAAVALRPGFAMAHFNLGKSLAAKQDFGAAEPEFRRAMAIDPDIAAAHVALGLLLAAKTGSVSAEARAELEKGLQLNPALRDIIPQEYLVQLH